MGDPGSEVPPAKTGGRLGPAVLGLLVLAGALAVTAVTYRSAAADEAATHLAAFELEVRQVQQRIAERMRAYEQILRGTAGLFTSSAEVTRAEFRSYVAALRLDEHEPGILGVGFAKVVPAAALAAHEGAVRAEGFPAYAVRPEGARDPYTPIVLLEPFTGRNLRAFGYDMHSEPVRRAAMQRAERTGEASLSGKVTLVQETETDVQAGALLYVPVHQGGALVGWTYSPYRMNDLMRGMLGERGADVALRVFDGDPSPQALLYDSRGGERGPSGPPSRYRAERRLEVAGRTWTLDIRSLPALEARLAGGRARLVAAAGVALSLLLSVLVLALAAGRARALRAAAQAHRDLAERQRAAEALQAAQRALAESEARLRGALVASSQVTWELDVPSSTATFGPGWQELMGRELPPTLGAEAWTALLHPDDRDPTLASVADCLEGRTEEHHGEYRIETARGWRWVRARGRVTRRDADGRPLRMSGTLGDVHDVHLLQERLVAANRLASVGTLAAGMAHEINNPLAWMHGDLGLALERLDEPRGDDAAQADRDADLRRLVQEAIEGTERIAGVVKALRGLGRPERAAPARPVDVRAEVLDAVKVVRNLVEQRAALTVAVPSTLPAVRAKVGELSRAFLNLLLNAAQAVPEGAPDRHRVAVSARAEGGEVAVEVSDTGAGLAPEVRARIFEPFFTTKDVGQGTGLGLAITHAIVTGAGGRIEVESEPGHGATFRVRLPTAGEEHPAPVPPPRGPAPRPRRRVLLVDDEPATAAVLSRRLASHHEVATAVSGAEVLARLEAGERWDALLVDLMMPGLDGVGLHQALAARWPALLPRMAFLTGGAFGDRTTSFLASHDVLVIGKPATLEALLEAVDRLAPVGADA